MVINNPENYEYDEIDYLLSFKEKNGLIFVDYEKALRNETDHERDE